MTTRQSVILQTVIWTLTTRELRSDTSLGLYNSRTEVTPTRSAMALLTLWWGWMGILAPGEPALAELDTRHQWHTSKVTRCAVVGGHTRFIWSCVTVLERTHALSRQGRSHYLTMSEAYFTMSNDTFTIIQRTALDSWSIVDVVQGDVELAYEPCRHGMQRSWCCKDSRAWQPGFLCMHWVIAHMLGAMPSAYITSHWVRLN